MFFKNVEFSFLPDSLPKVRGRGVIRVPVRNSKCWMCGDLFLCTDKSGYVCPNCGNTPNRFYIDIHYRGKRVKVFCDKQGKALDTNQRAYDMLAYLNIEIENNTFEPSMYIRAEQKSFYASVRLEEYLNYKIDSLAPTYQSDFKRCIRIAKEFFYTKDIRDIKKVDIIGYEKHLKKTLA